jgi:uncharacterized membrane protein YeaQ/YmgE (transglycosylase-associated protein family)
LAHELQLFYQPISASKEAFMLWTLIVGLIVGAIAKFLMPGRDPGGFIITMLIGVAGAFVASFIGDSLGWYEQGEPAGFVASVVGAVILLTIYRAVIGRRQITHHRGV